MLAHYQLDAKCNYYCTRRLGEAGGMGLMFPWTCLVNSMHLPQIATASHPGGRGNIPLLCETAKRSSVGRMTSLVDLFPAVLQVSTMLLPYILPQLLPGCNSGGGDHEGHRP